MIGIIGAMDEEVNKLKEVLEDAQVSTVAGMNFFKGLWMGERSVMSPLIQSTPPRITRITSAIRYNRSQPPERTAAACSKNREGPSKNAQQ